MTIKKGSQIVLLLSLTVTIASGVHAQSQKHLGPTTITVRDIGLLRSVEDNSFGFTTWRNWIMWVGDSGVVVSPLADDTVPLAGYQGVASVWNHYQLDPSVTFYALSYFDTLHAVIGGSGGAVYHTQDAGKSWQRSALGTSTTVRGLTYNQQGVHLAACDSGLIFRSMDSGVTWSRIEVPGASNFSTVCFGSETVAIAAGQDSSIFKSIDGGLTWKRVSGLVPLVANLHNLGSAVHWSSIAMTGEDTVLIALEKPEVMLFSYDGMNTFDTAWLNPSIKAGPIHKVIYCGLDIHPNAAITAIAVGEDDVFHVLAPGKDFHNWLPGNGYYVQGDADGGTDVAPNRYWCASYDATDTAIVFAGDNALVAVPSTVKNPFNFSANGLNDLSVYPTPFWLPGLDSTAASKIDTSSVASYWPQSITLQDWLSVSVLPSGIGCSVLVPNTMLLTSDGGADWYASGVVSNTNINTSLILADGKYITIGAGGTIIRQVDKGAGFNYIKSGTTYKLHGIAFPTPNDGIIVGDNGTILRSTDIGKSWTSISNANSEYLYDVAFANDSIGIAVGDKATILRTSDRGLNWSLPINNPLTGMNYSIRQVQAFKDGTCFFRANTFLLRSTDFGLNWQEDPNSINDSLGMSFYDPKNGIVADSAHSSALVPDTAFFSYTTDSAKTWKSFSVPMMNYNRVEFQWIDDHDVILYGINCFQTLVNFSGSGVSLSRISHSRDFSIFPNPSSGEVHINYTSKTNSGVFIELYDESGRASQTLFSGDESAGEHEHILTIPKWRHGACFIRLTHDGITSTAPVSVE